MEKPITPQERARLRSSRTPDFYRQFVANFDASGLTAAQYCRKHHVGQCTFYKFRKHSQNQSPVAASKRNTGVPTMVKVLPSPWNQGALHPFEIQLPTGVVVRLAHLDSQIIAALSPLLMGARP